MLKVLTLLRQLAEKVAHTLQSHIVLVKIVASREVGVGGTQMQVRQAIYSSLHLGIILTNVGLRIGSNYGGTMEARLMNWGFSVLALVES